MRLFLSVLHPKQKFAFHLRRLKFQYEILRTCKFGMFWLVESELEKELLTACSFFTEIVTPFFRLFGCIGRKFVDQYLFVPKQTVFSCHCLFVLFYHTTMTLRPSEATTTSPSHSFFTSRCVYTAV